MAMHSLQRVLAAAGVLAFFGLSLLAFSHAGSFHPAGGPGALLTALAIAGLVIRSNYRSLGVARVKS